MCRLDRDKLLEELCDRYPYVVRLMKIMGVDEDDIEDLATEVFIDAFKGIEGLKDPEKLMPWLKAIASNRASRYFRKRHRRMEISNMINTEAGEIDAFDTIADEMTVESIMQEAEERELAGRLINSLSDINRRILRMRFWGGYKHSEIARILNININTEKSIYRRSLKQLRDNYFLMMGKEDRNE